MRATLTISLDLHLRCVNGCSRFRFNSRIPFAVHPELLSPLLQCIHGVIATFLIKQSGLQRAQAHSGAVTLIQRFGSAANLNIHLDCLALDGVYHGTEGMPVFQEERGPTAAELAALLSGRERLRLPACAANQQVQGFAYRSVSCDMGVAAPPFVTVAVTRACATLRVDVHHTLVLVRAR